MTVEEVIKTLHTNAGNSRAVAAGLLQDVYDAVDGGKVLTNLKGSMQYSSITQPAVSSLLDTDDEGDGRADVYVGPKCRVEEEIVVHPALLCLDAK